ncbi:MAG TPA: YceI family protein [Flavitalea sp.]|nr:YceI family protein [Flavitalea sp.]
MTRNGNIKLSSDTPLESIRAENKDVEAAIDLNNRNIAFSLPLKSFVFTRSLMQEHFNEKYVESDKYPRSTFSGSFGETIPKGQDGSYPVKVRGKLTLHGVTRDVEIPGTFVRKGNVLTGTANFKLNPTDYKIRIPYIVRDKIEKETAIEVNIECNQKQ